MATFAEKLQKAMQTNNLTQTELSNLSGVGKSAISQYLSGKFEPRGRIRAKLEEVLGISFDDAGSVDTHKPFKFSTKPITLRKAARVMHMDEGKLAEEMETGKINIGTVYKSEGSSKRGFYISPKLFYELTGWYE